MEELLAAITGGRNSSAETRPRKATETETVHHTLQVSLEELYNGKTRRLKLHKKVLCPDCDATGSKSRTKPTDVCQACKGDGCTLIRVQLKPGFVQQRQEPCAPCGGYGDLVVGERCDRCSGARVVDEDK